MSEEQTRVEEPEKRHGGLTEMMQLDIVRNRKFIMQRADRLKSRHGTLYAIEKRFLLKLIEAERSYEEEITELFPNV